MSTLPRCLLVLTFTTIVASQDDRLIQLNITAPNGTTNHGNPQLLCFPSTQATFWLFFIGNYFAHSATVLFKPGATAVQQIFAVSNALVFPASGLLFAMTIISRFVTLRPLIRFLGCMGKSSPQGRAKRDEDDIEKSWMEGSASSARQPKSRSRRLPVIWQLLKHPGRGSNEDDKPGIQKDLQTAAKAGALCVLVRTKSWRPNTGNMELGEMGECCVVNQERRFSKAGRAGMFFSTLGSMHWILTFCNLGPGQYVIPINAIHLSTADFREVP
jgi:hypothetical protein